MLSFQSLIKRGNIAHPEASSARPPPSSAPAWVVEQTPPLRQQWPGSTDPKPRRSPQTRLHLSSSPEKKGSFIINPKYYAVSSMTACDFPLPSATLTTFHLSLTTSATDRMSVCSPAPLILSALSYSPHLASVTQAPHWKQGADFLKIHFHLLTDNHCTLHANERAEGGKRKPDLLLIIRLTVHGRNMWRIPFKRPQRLATPRVFKVHVRR